MFKKAIKLARLPFRRKLVLLEALFVLLLAKIIVMLVPLRKVAPRLGVINQLPQRQATNSQRALSGDIRMAIFMASANVPWISVCMDQALAAMFMLNRRGIPNTLYLGARMNHEERKVDAHAWIVCNDKIFVGGPQSRNYPVVAFFSKLN